MNKKNEKNKRNLIEFFIGERANSIITLLINVPRINKKKSQKPCPESILACFRAAASSILNLGIPLATALAMPPIFSTSSITFVAARQSSSVKDSIKYEPPHGSTT